MSSQNSLISIVSPLHNEKENVEDFCERVVKALEPNYPNFELVLVDDGSSDGTTELIKKIVDKESRVRALILTRNFGQWAAVFAGIQASQGDWIVIMDSDLQHLPEEIHLLLDRAMEGQCDMVSGWRQQRSEGFFTRKFPSLIANAAIRKATGCDVHDMGGFKCIQGDLARSLRLMPGYHRFLPALVHLQGGVVVEVSISAPPRLRGQSHYGMGRTLNVLFDIVSLYFQASFLNRPLHLLGRVALVFIFMGVVTLVWLMVEKFLYGVPMGTRPPLPIAAMSILLGALFFLLGFVAETISTILFTVSDTRFYRIKTEYDNRQQ